MRSHAMTLTRLAFTWAFTWLLALCSLPALAANYTFPGSMPAGCSGSNGTYTCGALSLGYNDTITIAGVTPATITVNGNFTTNNARINQSGTASNLTLTVNGTLRAEYQANLNANVSATVVNASDTEVRFGGNVATTTGSITLGFNNTVSGNITSTTGAIDIGGTSQVAGQVSCSCAVSLDYDARISGNVSAASVTGDGRVYLMGSVTTTGAVDVGYDTTLGGAVTAGGTIRLRGDIQASQCLRSTNSSTITLAYADRANGGVCCGALGACTTSCVNNGSGAAMPALCSGSPPVTLPARFNAFDTTTASGIAGNIKTKVSGTTFSVAVVAVNTAGTAVATTFTGNVRVEVLDASTAGTVNSTTNCSPTWTVASGTSAVTLNFAASDAGRKSVSFTVAEAFRNARIRVSYPDTGTATVVGCSTDNFAIRPSGFANLNATDATAGTTGTARALSNTGATGGVVHKAGQPFTVRATVTNGAGATLTTYTGTPTVLRTTCGSTYPCSSNLGALTLAPALLTAPNTGLLSDTNARYLEAGDFNLQLIDSSFAAVDATDGSTDDDREIRSSTVTVGRFVPDRFGWTVTATPALQAACGAFTYYGQTFGYGTAPQATLTPLAENGSTAGSPIANYPGSRYSPAGSTTVQVSAAYTPATLVIGGSATPSISAIGSTGTASVVGPGATHTLTVARTTNAPQAEAAYGGTPIGLTWTAQDTSETAVSGNLAISGSYDFGTLAFVGGASNFRYGQLKLGSAYGSELIPLAVPMETQYWNGTSFVTNAADSCTVLSTSAVALASYRGALAACDTSPTAASVTFASGRASMRLKAPGNAKRGSVDGTLQLGTTLAPTGALRCAASPGTATAAVPSGLTWLQSRAAGGTTFDQNPSARFSFGQYKSPVIQLREMY